MRNESENERESLFERRILGRKFMDRWNERKETGVESKDGEERETATGNRREKTQRGGRELIKSL